MMRGTSDPRLGRYIKEYTKNRTRDAITSLAKLKPTEAFVVGLIDKTRPSSSFPRENHDIENGNIGTDTATQMSKSGSKVQKVPADLLEAGDIIRVPKGATPAIDGVVVSGPSLFDESAVTGESKPIRKGSGDHVFLGTINVGQAIDVRIDVTEGKTMSVPSFVSSHATLTRV
jgi:P-type Cu+ transporter